MRYTRTEKVICQNYLRAIYLYCQITSMNRIYETLAQRVDDYFVKGQNSILDVARNYHENVVNWWYSYKVKCDNCGKIHYITYHDAEYDAIARKEDIRYTCSTNCSMGYMEQNINNSTLFDVRIDGSASFHHHGPVFPYVKQTSD